MKTRTTILICACAALTALSCAERPTAAEDDVLGVWADADSELLRTERFALLFERCDTLLTATLHRLDPDTALLGRVVFGPRGIVGQQLGASPACGFDPGKRLPSGELRLLVDGRERQLRRIERIVPTAPYEMLRAESGEVGSCLQQWTSGASIGVDDEAVQFEAGTNRHSYMFLLSPGMVYCRAARMRYGDRGALFAQNIRMMANPNTGEYTAEMADDNAAVSGAPLHIDEAKFRPDQCTFDADGIYWSFIGFDGETILLNGCGETYRFDRPETKAGPDEWFAFEKY
ncbi:hypothetical protein [uncultured Alistipes sp.]|uniref:hypothetical protein n=1 Tax=uncultured Alistipes sp. TaxID=538949 RepID=UPI0025E502EE|nr:hypothetical protein [uncultured Alistipes sp.]